MPAAVPDVRAIFLAAAEKAAADRAAFLKEACAGDAALRERVEALLRAHDASGAFLSEPPPDPAGIATAAQTPPSADPAAGLVIAGRYKLLEPIGEGGMGTVWMAQQTEPVKRLVAVKLIKLGMDSKAVLARFEAERQALALMDHPNIAKVLDGGTTHAGRPFFVMELVKGLPLTEYCDGRRLPVRDRLDLFVQMCSAVQHAHQKGLIHRDLKPSNILVTEHDGKPVPKVIDFGLAKALQGPQALTARTLYTAFGTVVGTPLYMAPEQVGINALDVDTRTDIYALGVLLYELLTGTTPLEKERFKEAAWEEMKRLIREEEPPRPSVRLSTLAQAALSTVCERRGLDTPKLGQQVRGELDWIVMKALEKDRNRRYESASAFAADVQRYLKDEPVQACPPSAGYRLRKFARRNKARLIVAACALAAFAVFSVIVGTLLSEKASRRAQVEEEVKLALRDADLLQGQKKWTEAAAAAKRAQGVLRAGPANKALQELVEQRVADLTLVAELEQIFTDRLARLADRYWTDMADQEIEARYERAFRDAGIDVKELDVATAATLIGQRDSRAELAAALDAWTDVRHASMGDADPFWRQLRELATAVDPDPFRVLMRKAASWRELQEGDSKRIVSSPELLDQPVPVVMSFAMPLLIFEKEKWLEVLHKLHRRHPEDFWVNYELGFEHSDPVEALRFSTAAVAIRPENAGARLILGQALERQGRLDDAIISYQDAIRLKPDRPHPHLNLGNALSDKGRWDEGIATFKEALRLKQDYAPAHLGLGVALARKGQLDQAATSLNDAIRLTLARPPVGRGLDREGLASAYRNLGTVQALQGKVEEAVASWRKAVRSNPDDAYTQNSLAWFLATCPTPGLRDSKQAVTHAEKAAALTPKDGRVWNTLGIARYRNGDWKAAVEALTKSVQLGKDVDSVNYFFLAMALWQLGDKERARTWYDQAVAWMDKNKPQDEELRHFRAEAAALLGVTAPGGSPAPPGGSERRP